MWPAHGLTHYRPHSHTPEAQVSPRGCWSEAQCYCIEDMTRPQGRREQGWGGSCPLPGGRGSSGLNPFLLRGISTTPRGLRKRCGLEKHFPKQLRVSCESVRMGVSPQAGTSLAFLEPQLTSHPESHSCTDAHVGGGGGVLRMCTVP